MEVYGGCRRSTYPCILDYDSRYRQVVSFSSSLFIPTEGRARQGFSAFSGSVVLFTFSYRLAGRIVTNVDNLLKRHVNVLKCTQSRTNCFKQVHIFSTVCINKIS